MTIENLGSTSAAYLETMGGVGSIDLETAILTLGAERTSTLDEVLAGQMKDMETRNQEIRDLQSAMQEVRKYKPSKDKKDGNFTDPATGQDVKLSAKTMDTLEKNGITGFIAEDHDTGNENQHGQVSHEITRDDAYQDLMDNCKNRIDQLSSSSQLDMIKLQGLVNKRNQAVEMMSNMLQKFSQLTDKIVGNMR
jgi:hypothetical protein